MPRWAWFLPVILLVAVAGLIGYRYGYLAAKISETDVINAYTARYLDAEPLGQLTDCLARPGERRGTWIVLTCAGGAAPRHAFHINRVGGLVRHEIGDVPVDRGQDA